MASSADADAVKIQKRTVDKLAVKVSQSAPGNRFPEFGTTYREIREHLEFDMMQHPQIKQYWEGRGLYFSLAETIVDLFIGSQSQLTLTDFFYDVRTNLCYHPRGLDVCLE